MRKRENETPTRSLVVPGSGLQVKARHVLGPQSSRPAWLPNPHPALCSVPRSTAPAHLSFGYAEPNRFRDLACLGRIFDSQQSLCNNTSGVWFERKLLKLSKHKLRGYLNTHFRSSMLTPAGSCASGNACRGSSSSSSCNKRRDN